MSNHITEEGNPSGFVVLRNGYRVSDKVYPTKNSPDLLEEFNFWKGIVEKWSKGDKVIISRIENYGNY